MARQDTQAGQTQNPRLRQCIQSLIPKILRDKDRRIGEENTKTTLIEPVLEALGWNIRDWEEVHKEFRAKPGDNPVDYALKALAKPKVFLEAKGLGENLDERKWVSQVLSYATTAGVVWCILTDGDEYRFYNSTAPVDAEEKEFCRIQLSKPQANLDETVGDLALVSQSNLDGGGIEERWSVHFVDRRVKAALDGSLNPPEKELVSLIHRKVPDLPRKDIVASFARLDFRISLVPRQTTSRMVPSTNGPVADPPAETTGTGGGRTTTNVSLADLIAARALTPPVRLFREYKGQMVEATLKPDGTVDFRGQRFDTTSAAAVAAKKIVTGEEKSTNGWDFWQVEGEGGRPRTLGQVRDAYPNR